MERLCRPLFLGLFFLLVPLPTNLAAISCKEGQYYDDVMKKCFSCKILCRGDTLHDECPFHCPDTYNKLQKEAKEAKTASPTLHVPPAEEPVVSPEPKASSSSSGGGSEVHVLVVAVMAVFVCLVGVVVTSGFILYRKKSSRGRPGDNTLSTSGHTSLSASRDIELVEPFLRGGSLPVLAQETEETFLKTPMGTRPASADDLAQVHFHRHSGTVTVSRQTGSVSLGGKPIRHPQDEPHNISGNPFTESQRLRSQSDNMFREMWETTV